MFELRPNFVPLAPLWKQFALRTNIIPNTALSRRSACLKFDEIIARQLKFMVVGIYVLKEIRGRPEALRFDTHLLRFVQN
jgi:hypothetical protein